MVDEARKKIMALERHTVGLLLRHLFAGVELTPSVCRSLEAVIIVVVYMIGVVLNMSEPIL